MGAEELKNLARMESEALLDAPARAQMRQCNPGMLRVPDNRRNGAESENDEQRIQAGPRKIKQEQARGGGEHRTEKAHTELICAKNGGAGAHGKSDTWPLAEICRGNALRPHPVMRFVEFEIGRRQHRQSNRGQRENEKPDRARGRHKDWCRACDGCALPFKSS